ncbi:MAG TPA: RodZ domain-containing protein [Terriglobales bacterium]|nr:RodZ domain-containing protein [Terriglobales bacterium]
MTSFGAQLKKEREKQGVSLEDISVSTKIGTRMLRALEEEHFDQLPGGIFNKGFIRAYARCLHMDEDQAVADYLAATGFVPPAKDSVTNDQAPLLDPPSREQTDTNTGLPWSTFAVVLLIIALGFAAWGFYSRESQKAAPESTAPAANSPSPSPSVTTEQSPPPQAPPQQPAESTNSSPAPAKPTEPSATPSPAESMRSQSPGTPDATPSTSQLKPAIPANAPLLVLIKAREDSWLSVSVDGEIVTRALLSAPAQKSIRAEKEIVIKAGNVGALDFEFNGKKLPTQGDYGEVKTLTFDARGLQPPVPKTEAPTQSP